RQQVEFRLLTSAATAFRHIETIRRFTFSLPPARTRPTLPTVALVVILLVVGVALLLLETMLPGLVAGIIGLCCLLAGIALSYGTFEPRIANLILVSVLLLFIGGFAIWVKFFPESRLGRRFISRRVVGNIDADKPELLYKTGIDHTPLRPSGTAIINGKRIDVVTEGPFVERGA